MSREQPAGAPAGTFPTGAPPTGEPTTSPTVGLIGLGLLGSALAERWLGAGWPVVGFDISAERRREFAEHGGRAVTSLREVTDQSSVCFLSLPNSEVASDVLRQLAGGLAGKMVVDTTTGSPESAELFARELVDQGASFLDATVVGSSQQAKRGEVVVLVGGESATWEAGRRYLEPFSRQSFHLGPAGSGARMKLVVNLVLGLNRAVLAEGLAFAEASGVAPEVALTVLRSGMSYSRIMDTKGEKMLRREFWPPEARLAQHHKDVRLMLEAAERAGATLPLSTAHERLLATAEQLGWADHDNSAVIMAYRGQQP